MADFKFGDVVATREDRSHRARRLMYICPGEHPHSFRGIVILEDPTDPMLPVGVGAFGHIYPNWARHAFELVDD